MSRRDASYYPLVLALLFGLAISFIPVSPALSDNITACQGTGNSPARVILGGRVVTPSTILRTANGQPCAQNELALNLFSTSTSPIFTRTIIVSPVGTPLQNGAGLLSAMSIISSSNPSANNPWLLKLEPGSYDLNNGSLTLLPYVDLEGSGEINTVIFSSIGNSSFPTTTATLFAASNSEVRFVKIANSGPSNFDNHAAVMVPPGTTNSRFTYTSFSASGYTSFGLYVNAGTTFIQNSTFIVTDGLGGDGLYNYGGIVSIQASSFSATNNASQSAMNGLYNDMGGTITVQNSSFTAYSNSLSTGLYNFSGKVSVQNSILTGSGGAGSVGYGIINGTPDRATALVATSQISGTHAISGGLTVCSFSYHTDFTPLNANCQ